MDVVIAESSNGDLHRYYEDLSKTIIKDPPLEVVEKLAILKISNGDKIPGIGRKIPGQGLFVLELEEDMS